jgi:hypothetical protein
MTAEDAAKRHLAPNCLERARNSSRDNGAISHKAPSSSPKAFAGRFEVAASSQKAPSFENGARSRSRPAGAKSRLAPVHRETSSDNASLLAPTLRDELATKQITYTQSRNRR